MRFALVLVLGCVLALGDFRPFSVELGSLDEFDRDRDGRMSLEEVQTQRVPLRDSLARRVQVQCGGKTLHPSLRPTDDGLLLVYGLPPQGDVTVQAGSGPCRGQFGDDAFVLAPGERRLLGRGRALETLVAIGLLLLCPLLPALLFRKFGK